MLAMVAKVRVRGAVGARLPCKQNVGSSTLPGSTCMQQVAAAATLDAGVAQLEELRSEEPRVPRSNRGAGTALAVLASFRVPALRRRTGVAQLVAHSPHKREVAGSNPASGTHLRGGIPMSWPAKSGSSAGIVQQAEQRFRKPQVGGSKPSASSAAKAGLTTTSGRVPGAATGTGCSPVGPRAFASSSLASPTGTTAGGLYSERVVKLVKTVICKITNTGSTPVALSGRNESRECCTCAQSCAWKPVGDAPAEKTHVPGTALSVGTRRAVVERYNAGLSIQKVRVQVPSALLRKRQGNDTNDAFVRHARVAQLVERRVANAQVAGPNPVSRSAMRGAGTGILARHGRAGVAQLVERQPSKLDVAGSIPVSRSRSSSSSIVVI